MLITLYQCVTDLLPTHKEHTIQINKTTTQVGVNQGMRNHQLDHHLDHSRHTNNTRILTPSSSCVNLGAPLHGSSQNTHARIHATASVLFIFIQHATSQ